MTSRRALTLATAALTFLLMSPAAHATALARLLEATGDVTVHSGALVRPGVAGAELLAGDAVRTGARASATIERIDGSTVELLPFSELVIENERGFWLKLGRLWSHFMKATGDPFFIRTPNATALIRGTTLGVDFVSERSRVVVVEGLVEVHGTEGRVDVPAGFRVHVDHLGRLERLERAEVRDQEEGRLFRLHRGLEGASHQPPGMMPERAPAGMRQIQGQPGPADDRRVPGEDRRAPGLEHRRVPGERMPRRAEQLEHMQGPGMDAEAGGRAGMLERRERLMARLRKLEEARAKQGAGAPPPSMAAQEDAMQRMLRLERRP